MTARGALDGPFRPQQSTRGARASRHLSHDPNAPFGVSVTRPVRLPRAIVPRIDLDQQRRGMVRN